MTHKHFGSAACIYRDRLWLFAGRIGASHTEQPHGNVESYDLARQVWKQEPNVGYNIMVGSLYTPLVIPQRSQVGFSSQMSK